MVKNIICDRCKKATSIIKVSYFNLQRCCLDCIEKESKHPLYKEAKRIEHEEVLKGNYNFEGIGLPDELKPF